MIEIGGSDLFRALNNHCNWHQVMRCSRVYGQAALINRELYRDIKDGLIILRQFATALCLDASVAAIDGLSRRYESYQESDAMVFDAPDLMQLIDPTNYMIQNIIDSINVNKSLTEKEVE
jgi:hypothetical protein